MVDYPLVKFVTAPVASPTVLLDLNDAALFTVKADGFSLGAPSFDGDPLSKNVKWGYRTITLHLSCAGTNAAVVAEYGLLAREITKETNLLMFQVDASASPVFFTTYRTSPGEIDMSRVNMLPNSWDLTVTLLADSFAVGVRQDLTSVAISNDPLAATNPMNATLGTVLGDVPTPAFVYHLSGAFVGLMEMLGIDHAAATTGVPPVDQGEGNTYGLDTANTAVAAASNGNVARVASTTALSAAGAAPVTRISGIYLPATEPGSYRLFARMRLANAVAASYRVRYVEVTGGAVDLVGDMTTFAGSTTDWFFVDLGVFQFPAGSSMGDVGMTGVPMARDTAAVGSIQAARDSGASGLDIDFVMAVPAYGDLSFTSANINSGGHYLVWDGYSDTQSLLVGGSPLATPLYYPGAIMSRVGGIPWLWPGQVNRLWHVWNMGGVGSPHQLTDTVTLSVSYWPRYLYLKV